MNCCGEMVSFTRSVADLLCESFMLAKYPSHVFRSESRPVASLRRR